MGTLNPPVQAYDEPLARVHFRGEGDVEFTAVLYLPKMAPFDMYDSYYSRKAQVKLYVRRVFITDEMEDFLPKYLSFLVGLVDSDSLPLNVSREMLQQHASLKTIKKKIVRKALDMIKRLADAEKAKRTAPDDLDQDTKELAEKYTTFWKEFGKALKLGIIEDATNRNRLAKLMRFHTSKSGEALTDLEEYIGRMKEGQKHIYFLTGASKEELAASPFLEQLTAQDYEVIYFTDPLDEYMMNSLKEYDDREFANASKEDLKIGKKDKTKLKAMKEAFKDFTKWWADAIGDKNVDVKLSQRLSTTPCIVVTSKYGWSANMERIMRAQALGDSEKQSYMKAKRFLEINPRHAMVSKLKELVRVYCCGDVRGAHMTTHSMTPTRTAKWPRTWPRCCTRPRCWRAGLASRMSRGSMGVFGSCCRKRWGRLTRWRQMTTRLSLGRTLQMRRCMMSCEDDGRVMPENFEQCKTPTKMQSNFLPGFHFCQVHLMLW